MKGFTKKEKIYLGILTVLFLLGSTLIGLFLIKGRVLIFPRASGYDITGKWQINTILTAPSSESYQELATIAQDASGRFTGTTTDTSGGDPLSISGTVTGNQMVTDPISFSGTEMGITYSGSYTLSGTIASGNTSISGTVSGQLTQPSNDTITGTFSAVRLEGPSSTPTPTATATSRATPTPTPTATSTGSATATTHPTATPITIGTTAMPVPVTGPTLPTIGMIIIGFFLVAVALIL